MKRSSGCTLIELMIALFIVVSIGTVIFSIFFMTLRGSKKSVTISQVRENGGYVISQMSRTLQFSLDATPCEGETASSITVTTQDRVTTTYACTPTNITSLTNGVTRSYLNTSQVSLLDCELSCTDSGPSIPKRINIGFTLTSASNSQLAENRVEIPFQTTVVLRNTGTN